MNLKELNQDKDSFENLRATAAEKSRLTENQELVNLLS